MKVRIYTPIANLTADLEATQVRALLSAALEYASGATGEAVPAPAPAPTKDIKEILDARYGRLEPTATPAIRAGYKGFLYIKCEECGNLKGFCPKTPITYNRCECGHKTELRDMKTMNVRCKCGASFYYQTNSTDSTISINCIKCGAPVDLEYHEKKNSYETI